MKTIMPSNSIKTNFSFTKIEEKGFFYGYDLFVWYLVALNACGGLIVAVVVKYADNILKGFACSMAIIITCILSGKP